MPLLACLVLVFLVMLGWSWFDWPDPIVDFGRELYVPWQIDQGRVLYRDLAYFNGPFSPYFNAAVFKILGTSLRSIVIANLTLLAALTAMTWWLFSIIADRFAATVACIVLLTVFSFLQLGGIANYNFVTPYSHEITHGVILSVAGMCCVARFAQKRKPIWLIAAGFALGLVFLTKPEVCLAAVLALAIGAVLSVRAARGRAAPSLGGFAVSAIIPPLIGFLLLLLAMPARDALRGVLGGWIYVGNSDVTGMLYYKTVLGIDQPAQSLLAILGATTGYAVWIGLAMVPILLTRSPTRPTAVAVGVVWTVIALMAFATVDPHIWQSSLRGMSVVMPALAIGTLIAALMDRGDSIRAVRAMVCIFAAALLGKILFNVTSYHYGFALAMPATLVSVAALLSWLPALVRRRWGEGATLLVPAILPIIGLFILVHLYIFGLRYARKATRVGIGADSFFADPAALPNDTRGQSVNLMLEKLHELDPGATLACIPEGIMVNYLSRRTNPTGYVNLMPPEVLMYGQKRIIADFERHPPDYIMLVLPSDPSTYGYKSFAADYGAQVFEWIRSHYEQIPAPTTPNYPLMLLKKKPGPAS